MSKWAEVTVHTATTYAVEVEDSETAYHVIDAVNEALSLSAGTHEIKDPIFASNERQADSFRRNADEALPL